MSTMSRVVSDYYSNTGLHLARSEYLTILKLSTMWDFEELRKATIKRLTTADRMSEYELFFNGVVYHVDAWEKRGLGQLISRDDPLSCEEMEFMISIGKKLLWKYAVIRECCRNKSQKQINLSFSCSCSKHSTSSCCSKVKGFPTSEVIVHSGNCNDARKQLDLKLDTGSELKRCPKSNSYD